MHFFTSLAVIFSAFYIVLVAGAPVQETNIIITIKEHGMASISDKFGSPDVEKVDMGLVYGSGSNQQPKGNTLAQISNSPLHHILNSLEIYFQIFGSSFRLLNSTRSLWKHSKGTDSEEGSSGHIEMSRCSG
ncbi:hypothetical protein IFR05_007077 [Cadophora sp. M221]|nr:hypothetical protein IFR05_007077 [Cadophora sp. M221]